MLIYLSAGEHSGDMHGANLAKALRAIEPDVRLLGMGGPLMREAGVEIFHDPTAYSTIGFLEALSNLGRYRQLLSRAKDVIAVRRPDVVVWIDFGGFNLALAKECRVLGIPVVCIFSPSAWAYGQYRAKLMAERLTELAAILPFEADFYRRHGVRTTFVGHPLVDLVKPTVDPKSFRAEFGLAASDRLFALLPGSRRQEIERLLPVMLSAFSLIEKDIPGLLPLLPVAPSIPRYLVEKMILRYGVPARVIPGRAYDVLAASEAALIGSGTATMEAAILGVPFVSIYRVSTLSSLIYRLLRNPSERGKAISTALPNLVAGRRVVPELLQRDLTPAALAAAGKEILLDPGCRSAILSGLREVREALGGPDVMSRVARIVLRAASSGQNNPAMEVKT